jgi:hypothetical protein
VRLFNPVTQRIEDDPPHDETPIEAVTIDEMRIPFAKHVIRAFVGRVRVIMRANIHRQFVQPIHIEVRVRQNFDRRGAQELQRAFDDVVVSTVCDTDIAEEQRNWPRSLVRIRFGLSPILEHGQGAIPKEIIQPSHGPRLSLRDVNETLALIESLTTPRIIHIELRLDDGTVIRRPLLTMQTERVPDYLELMYSPATLIKHLSEPEKPDLGR